MGAFKSWPNTTDTPSAITRYHNESLQPKSRTIGLAIGFRTCFRRLPMNVIY